MNVSLKIIAAFALSGAAITSASATTISFDDTASSGFGVTIPNGYAGLTWNNVYTLDTVAYKANTGPSGYSNGTVSGTQVAFNGGGSLGSFSSATPFTFNSADFTAAWNNGLKVTVLGFVNGVQAYTSSFTLNALAPTLETFNWTNLTSVSFVGTGGTTAGYAGSYNGTQIAIDNLTINTPIASPAPEPATWAMMILGFGLAGVTLRTTTRRSNRKFDARIKQIEQGVLA